MTERVGGSQSGSRALVFFGKRPIGRVPYTRRRRRRCSRLTYRCARHHANGGGPRRDAG